MRFVERLNAALGARLEEDNRVYLLGADIADPYGGAFRATRGLSDRFGERVLSTPVSESALVGMASGMALAGLRPIVEVMFGDFIGLAFDQLLNHAVKFPAVYGSDCRCAIVLRSPMGGGRGYGPTHSQSLEKHFLGIPGLRVVAVGPHIDPLPVLRTVQAGTDPTLMIEAKSCYGENMRDQAYWRTLGWFAECFKLGGIDAIATAPMPPHTCHLSVIAYGAMALRLEPLLWKLAIERELFCQLIVPGALNPQDVRPILDRIKPSCRAITIEEATTGWHWGAGLQDALGNLPGADAIRISTLAAPAAPIPSGRANEEIAQIQDAEIEMAIETLASRANA